MPAANPRRLGRASPIATSAPDRLRRHLSRRGDPTAATPASWLRSGSGWPQATGAPVNPRRDSGRIGNPTRSRHQLLRQAASSSESRSRDARVGPLLRERPANEVRSTPRLAGSPATRVRPGRQPVVPLRRCARAATTPAPLRRVPGPGWSRVRCGAMPRRAASRATGNRRSDAVLAAVPRHGQGTDLDAEVNLEGETKPMEG